MTATIDKMKAVGSSSEQCSPSGSTSKKRFTLDGSAELEAHLEQTGRQVLDGILRVVPQKKLEAVVLGGGYGRGEGGLLKSENGDRPYNDLEFYVLIRGNHLLNDRRYFAALHDLAARLSSTAGVDVEFKILSLAKLRRSPISMFYYDLVMGHRWLHGDETFLNGCEHHRQSERIPLSEATRLLMNRGAGLLFARERLHRISFSMDDADFVGRNLAKAQLAFGDAVLTAFGQYHWSCRERHQRLKRLLAQADMPWLEDVKKHHAAGVNFKLHPWRSNAPASVLQERAEEIISLALQLWLWVEERRLCVSFPSPSDYALNSTNKCPEASPWRNRLVNLRTFGPAVAFNSGGNRYPRERLFNALMLLLASPRSESSLGTLHLTKKILLTDDTDFSHTLKIFHHLWSRFS